MQRSISLLMPHCMLWHRRCAPCKISRMEESIWHLSLRMMVSLPSCPARHVASPDMSERQCSGDVLPGLHSTLASALADSEPCVQAARVYSPACNRNYYLESLSETVKRCSLG